MEHMNAHSAVELFRRVFAGEESPSGTLWNEAAATCVQGIKDGSLALFGALEDNALLSDDTRTMAAVEKLESMHPCFAAFCRECRDTAAAYNAASPRLGYYFCQLADSEGYTWQANWLRADVSAYVDLYIDLDFLFLSPNADYSVAFGSHSNYGCSANMDKGESFFIDHSWVDVTAFARHNADDKQIAASKKLVSRAFAGRRPFPCPFCGHQFVKSGLMGRKCPGCKMILPKC